MALDRAIFSIAGVFVLLSLVLAHLHSPHWLWFTGFVGVNMLQAGFSGFCPLALILKRAGLRPGQAFD